MKMLRRTYSHLLIVVSLAVSGVFMASCEQSKVPTATNISRTVPRIYPDYTHVTIPANIAPLRFKLCRPELYDAAVVAFYCRELGDAPLIVEKADGDGRFLFGEEAWHEMLSPLRGKQLEVVIFTRKRDAWTQHQPFTLDVAREDIDSCLVYRLLPPGYELWFEMGIYQRCLTDFTETAIAQNTLTDHNCMNCHSFCMQSPDTMMLHMRAAHGGTYILTNGKIKRVDGHLSNEIPQMVYPSWHPSGRFIAFSTNDTHQRFHMRSKNRIEVFDRKSSVFVYDVKNHRPLQSPLMSDSLCYSTFPTFSPDGRTLYFCAARRVDSLPADYRQVRYSLCSISFDAVSGTFGHQVDTLYSTYTTRMAGVPQGHSVSFPRVSPDGRHLVFTLSRYGNFSIWHADADLYLLRLSDGSMAPLRAANSANAESYHSWSHNSRWLAFSSRRDDGLHTRPYFTYIDTLGHCRKAFMLPQSDPSFYDVFTLSYNIPELVSRPVKATPHDFAEAARQAP